MHPPPGAAFWRVYSPVGQRMTGVARGVTQEHKDCARGAVLKPDGVFGFSGSGVGAPGSVTRFSWSHFKCDLANHHQLDPVAHLDVVVGDQGPCSVNSWFLCSIFFFWAKSLFVMLGFLLLCFMFGYGCAESPYNKPDACYAH